MNKVILQGNLTKDVVIRYTKSNKTVASFTVATNEKYFFNGEEKERTAFINCVAWGKLGESVGALNKGDNVIVTGRLQTRSYEAQDGTKRYVTEVIADFIGSNISNQNKVQESNFESFGMNEEIPF